ncbi:MAG: 3-dehydroquinate dehydratase [Solirubrobacterales bacterium]|nr:3-dehydroquinate dehydratase [Solirubrobacterales bacterium]
MSGSHNRIEVMHGVNLDQLGRRDHSIYGDLTLDLLEQRIEREAGALGLSTRFFRTNHEGDFVSQLHLLDGVADALIVNPGAWTHYSWAIRDALEIAAIPTVEVHLSDVNSREEWRRASVLDGLVVDKISGQGADGYTVALERLAELLAS